MDEWRERVWSWLLRGKGGGGIHTLDYGTCEIGLFEEGILVDELVIIVIIFFVWGVKVVAEVHEADAGGSVQSFAIQVKGDDAGTSGGCGGCNTIG